MKICMIGPVTPYRGGIAHFTTLLAQKLIEYGHDVQVISFKKQYPAWLYPGESDKDHSPGRERVDAQFLLKPLDPISWRKTLHAILDFAPQQVLFPWWVTFWGPAFHYLIQRLKRRGILVSILIHNTMPHEPRPWDRFLAKTTLKRADRFIVMTEKEKKRLQELLPASQNIHITPLPIDAGFKKVNLSGSEVRRKLDIPLDANVVLFFGIIRPYKGLRVLIDAFRIVTETKHSAHLLVVGEFWEDKNHYLTQVKNLGLKEQVHFTDRYIPDDEVSAYFETADLFVAPYVGGTQSAALRTALAFGLTVVLTDIIQDELTNTIPNRCLIVKSNDEIALSKGILDGLQQSVQDQEKIEELIENSWKGMVTAATIRFQPFQEEINS